MYIHSYIYTHILTYTVIATIKLCYLSLYMYICSDLQEDWEEACNLGDDKFLRACVLDFPQALIKGDTPRYYRYTLHQSGVV